jgi:hypothetical protein
MKRCLTTALTPETRSRNTSAAPSMLRPQSATLVPTWPPPWSFRAPGPANKAVSSVPYFLKRAANISERCGAGAETPTKGELEPDALVLRQA